MFRATVIASFALAIAAASVDHVVPNLIASPLRALPVGPPFANDHSHSALFIILGTLMLVSGVVSTVGLICFKFWARPLTVFSMLIGLPLYVLKGQFISSGYSEMFAQLANLFGGAVVALAYWSDVARRFNSAAA